MTPAMHAILSADMKFLPLKTVITLHVPDTSSRLQVDAATSIASGDVSYDNVHKAIFGFNQGTEGRHLLSEAVKVIL